MRGVGGRRSRGCLNLSTSNTPLGYGPSNPSSALRAAPMARAPPAARLALDARFPDVDVAIRFDGTNFEDYGFSLKTALTSCPAAVAILNGDLTRPHDRDATRIFPNKTGATVYSAFKAGTEQFSTGVVALSVPCTDPAYGTVYCEGVYNSPWSGDTYDYKAAQADHRSYEQERQAKFVPQDENDVYEPTDEAIYIHGALDSRIDHERDVVIMMRQREWDACDAFLYRTLVASTRPADLAVLRPHISHGRAAWE